MHTADFMVIGGGLVGSAIAYGLVRAGRRVVVLDGGDRDIRASRANYGIVWVQGKGEGLPPYQRWTRRSADAWPTFAGELEAESGIPLDYERTGGLTFCLGEAEYEARVAQVDAMRRDGAGAEADTEVVGRDALDRMVAGARLGAEVSGAVFCSRDAHVNPLALLVALQRAVIRNGGAIRCGSRVDALAAGEGGFVATVGAERHTADRIVIAAGIDSGAIARDVGLDAPVRPQRGQILVTERMERILPMPTVPIRQTAEGTVLIGSSQEEVGVDIGTTVDTARRMARRAVAILPALARATVVRHWSGLRIMSPDVAPIYGQSEACPGAWAATCHSGVTLAAAHATALAPAIAEGALPAELAPFHPQRFDVH